MDKKSPLDERAFFHIFYPTLKSISS